MSYLHTDIFSKQSSKKIGNPCGDVIGFERDALSTTIVLSDGIGSGIKANIAANLCVSRLLALIRNGATMREAFSSMVRTMNKAWGTSEPFAVFSVARILSNGETTILSYEIPTPILITKDAAKILSDRVYIVEKAVISEVNCTIEKGEGIVLMSDGIAQAGLGRGLINGWEASGVARFISQQLVSKPIEDSDLPILIHKRALELWGDKVGDDCSILFARSRNGVIINIMSGLPIDKKDDKDFVNEFIEYEGIKVVCGGSTSKVVARELRRQLSVDTSTQSSITPPTYSIDGINLVCEGVVTLNQAYNLLDEEVDDSLRKDTAVFELIDYLKLADCVNIWIGTAKNVGLENIEFRQQGILPRHKILDLIIEKLKQMGKLVVIHRV